MKIFAFIALFVVFLSVANAIPVKNIEDFVVGFADGVEIIINDNVTECVADAGVTFDDFESAFQDLEDGFKNKSIASITKGVEELGAGIQEVSLVLTSCDVGTIAADISAIAKQLQSGPDGVLDFIIKEGINIFHHGSDLTTYFKSAISAWKSGDFFNSGKAVGEITGVLLED